jgi:hypothetical protein
MKYFYCSLNGHDYVVTKYVTNHIKEYVCRNCKERFTTSQEGKITLLTSERKEINSLLEKIHIKKKKTKMMSSNF